MKPSELGAKYDKIALWWHKQHLRSSYGVSQLERAIEFASNGGKALDGIESFISLRTSHSTLWNNEDT